MPSSPLVSIITVNWNGIKFFNDCLSSLSRLDYPSWELIIVDNGSTDGSDNLVYRHKKLKNFKIIKNKSNLGFAKANNQGYKKSSGKYILLLNNDTIITPPFLKKMVVRMEQEKSLGVAQPKIFLIEKPKFLDNAGSYLTKTGFLSHWGFMEKDGPEFDGEQEIFSAKGACLLIRRELIERIGLFDEDFGTYFEESDFCWRVWLAGYKVIFYPQAVIYHQLGATSKNVSQIFINYHSAKNRILSMIKNLSFVNLIKILGLHLVILLGLIFYYLFRLQFPKSWMLCKAVGWNVVRLPDTLYKRTKIQKIRLRKDGQIFPIILRQTKIREMLQHFKRVEANFNDTN